VLLPSFAVYGQISTEEEPISLLRSIPALAKSEKTIKSFASLDMDKIEQEDMDDESRGVPLL